MRRGLVRALFNQPTGPPRGSPTGLFSNPYLQSPSGFKEYARRSLLRAECLAEHISKRHLELGGRDTIVCLDRLSDTLCAVLDMAEFVRNTHPDQRFIQAAEDAYGILHGFMSGLNTHRGLYGALKSLKDLPADSAAVRRILLADFYKSGIQLDDDKRGRYVDISRELSQAERRVFTDFAPSEEFISLPKRLATGIYPSFVCGRMRQTLLSVDIPTTGWEAHFALQRLEQHAARERLEQAMFTHRDDQIGVMDAMLRLRSELARLTGRGSYAEVALADLMARTPAAVEAFLGTQEQKIAPLVSSDVQALQRANGNAEFFKCDVDFLTANVLRQRAARRRPVDLHEFLSVGSVFEGLSNLFEALYGVELVPADPRPGETWHPAVRRLDVVHEDRGLIGVLYADLFSREGKAAGQAAHFTIRCGRRVDHDNFAPDEEAIESGTPRGSWKTNTFQLPVIALQCDFTPSNGRNFASLSFSEVSTLFHEMGHAMHSFLGTTDYHIVSGTRVAADFVELPSQIMESFAESPDIWPLFARHHSTDEPAPIAMLQEALHAERQLGGLQLHRQWLRATLDQRLHGRSSGEPDFSSIATLETLPKLFRGQNLPWHVQFTHLAGYGATYYSYLFDKAIADRIYSSIFRADPLSREAGAKFEIGLLRHGGSRDPWKCVSDVISRPELAHGGEEAMAVVGGWTQTSSSIA